VTRRQALGVEAARVHDLVEDLLDREDGPIVLVDRERVISFGEGSARCPDRIRVERCPRAARYSIFRPNTLSTAARSPVSAITNR
jgi:hypothetical protein